MDLVLLPESDTSCDAEQDDTHKNTQIYVAEQSIQEPIVTKKIDDYCQHQSDNRNVTTVTDYHNEGTPRIIRRYF